MFHLFQNLATNIFKVVYEQKEILCSKNPLFSKMFNVSYFRRYLCLKKSLYFRTLFLGGDEKKKTLIYKSGFKTFSAIGEKI